MELKVEHLFFTHVHLHGGPAPVRRYLPELIELVMIRKVTPAKSLISRCRSSKLRKGTARWLNAVRSRYCFGPDTQYSRTAA